MDELQSRIDLAQGCRGLEQALQHEMLRLRTRHRGQAGHVDLHLRVAVTIDLALALNLLQLLSQRQCGWPQRRVLSHSRHALRLRAIDQGAGEQEHALNRLRGQAGRQEAGAAAHVGAAQRRLIATIKSQIKVNRARDLELLQSTAHRAMAVRFKKLKFGRFESRRLHINGDDARNCRVGVQQVQQRHAERRRGAGDCDGAHVNQRSL